MENHKHKLLKQVALRWVQSTGCVVFVCEVCWYWCGIPDVLGIKKNGDVYIVEAKDTTADLRSDFKIKEYHRGLQKGQRLEYSRDVDFVYYIVSDGVDTAIVPTWIGLIDESGRVRRNAKRRQVSRTHSNKNKNFERVARRLSWIHYGWVIRGEQEQTEFSLVGKGG